jgi:hypothetical protein
MMTTAKMYYQSLEYIHFAFYLGKGYSSDVLFIVLLIFEYLVTLRKPTSAINVRIGNKEYKLTQQIPSSHEK